MASKLNEVCEFIVDTKHKTPKFTESGYPCIRTPNIGRGNFILGNAKFVSEESYIEWTERAVPSENDLIFAREAPVGNVAIIPAGLKVCHGQRTVLIRPNRNKVDSHYLMYLMLGDELQGRMLSMASGATVAHLNMSDIRSLELPNLPTLEEQKEISGVLSTYDNLIENNNRRIAILEEMAQSLYREWFVKFRFPGFDQSSGQTIGAATSDPEGASTKDGASQNTKFIDSSLGKIPEGWEVMSASEAVDINPRTKLPKEGKKLFVPMSGLFESSMLIGDIQMKSGNSGAKFINGDTLFARITPCLENGKTGYVQFLDEENPVGFGSTEFIVLREKILNSEYIYTLARSDSFRDHAIKSMTGASGRQRVQNACFDNYFLPVPAKKLLDDFQEKIKPIYLKIYNLSKKNNNLKKQRDLLLPKLIAGKVVILN